VDSEADWRRRFRAPRLTLPSWARDEADRLIYRSNAGGKWEVYEWDRAADTHRRVTDRPEGTVWAALQPDGERIWWFDDERGNEFGHWVSEPFGGGAPEPVAPRLADAYQAGLALGRGLAVIGRSDDDGTHVHAVGPGLVPHLLYEHAEQAEVAGLSRDGELICLLHSEHGDSRHPALRVLTLEGTTVGDLWDGEGFGLHDPAWSRVQGDRRILGLHEREGLLRPFIWAPEGGARRDISLDLPGDVWASWYPYGRGLLIGHGHRGRGELFRYDLESGALDPLPVEPGTVLGAEVRPNGEVWYAWTRASIPPEVRAGRRVLLRPPGEPAPGGVAYSDVDAGGVHGFLAEPTDRSRPHPTLFLIHGGPDSHDVDAFSPQVQAWVDHGFAVVMANYRGSSGYGKAWRDAITGNPGLTELEDIAHVHDHVVRAGIADPARIVLSGASWGGYLTLLGLALQPERWSLGIAGVPVADYVAAFEDEMEPLKAYDRALFGGGPEEIPDVYRDRSPITFVDRVRVPVLILAGHNDPRCPIRQIEHYITRLEELGRPHEVYRYEAGHGSLVIDEVIRQLEVQLDFASRHLGTVRPL